MASMTELETKKNKAFKAWQRGAGTEAAYLQAKRRYELKALYWELRAAYKNGYIAPTLQTKIGVFIPSCRPVLDCAFYPYGLDNPLNQVAGDKYLGKAWFFARTLATGATQSMMQYWLK